MGSVETGGRARSVRSVGSGMKSFDSRDVVSSFQSRPDLFGLLWDEREGRTRVEVDVGRASYQCISSEGLAGTGGRTMSIERERKVKRETSRRV